MKNESISINLVRNRNKDTLDKIIKWSLTVGRLIVMITEIIALSAFLYRFSLDRQLIDLRDKIKQKEAVVGFLKSNEKQYRNLQERLALAAETENKGNETTQLFKEITDLTPKGVVFSSFSLSKDSIRISAYFRSISTLTSFLNELKAHPKIASVSLDKIENKTSSVLIVVSITALIKK